uniref:Uncharacterized protein n=1 Tax=Zea mays TaxID=4577 RepID=A0A804QHR2_MAIZE
MAWGEDEPIGPDVASAGLHVSERIGRDAVAQPDLEEALEASCYASHPYSSHPKEDDKGQNEICCSETEAIKGT